MRRVAVGTVDQGEDSDIIDTIVRDAFCADEKLLAKREARACSTRRG
jgi:hypothetical protein